MTNRAFTAAEISDQKGRTFVITGANSGLGYETALALAGVGAHVVLACRSEARAVEAMGRIREQHPGSELTFMSLDLASLASVRVFAEKATRRLDRIDVLINNAGLMGLPYRQTEDGFEMVFGVNHLGHFALTGLLLDRIIASGSADTPARVVTVSSIAHRAGRIRFEDIHWERSYWRWPAYGMSKLANLLFTCELQRRVEQAGLPLLAVSCHPGVSETNLVNVAPSMEGARFRGAFLGLGNKIVTQPAWKGALPTLWAATHPDTVGGDYIGPGGPFGAWGYPSKGRACRAAYDTETAARLWDLSTELTGVEMTALQSHAEPLPFQQQHG